MAVSPEDMSLLTDLYELTMAQTYWRESHNEPATFSLFIRRYPPHRGYFVSCGLEDVLRYLEELRFTTGAIDRLRRTGIFSDDFLDYLRRLRFTGNVRAVPEGRLFFCDEPVLEITAPMIEAQIVETFIINQMNLQCLAATKAARCVYAAHGRSVVDFSLRRTQGVDAGMKVARASYIAGCTATSNVLAGVTYGIPLSGTMAHSFVSSYENEIDAFRAFARNFPDRSILIIETYDAIGGAYKAVEIAGEMKAQGRRLIGVRIDSGDLLSLGRQVRRILDEAGLQEVMLVGSGGLDEFDIEHLTQENAPYEAYGVGTKMGVSADAPWSDMVYKLVRYGGNPVLKLSTGKASLPGAKQVFRYSEGRLIRHDVISLDGEMAKGGEPLLATFMNAGKVTARMPALSEVRDRFFDEFARLGDRFKSVREPETYPVEISDDLRSLSERLQGQITDNISRGPRRGGALGE